MSIEAIEEYLAIAEHCVVTSKKNGGLYGYPSVLLLLCIVDALSNYSGCAKNTLRGIQSIFPGLTDKQIQDLKNWYRNLPAHQAIIMPGTQLSAESTGTAIEFGTNAEPTLIRVIPFYKLVKQGWEAFDKSRIDPKFEQRQAPKQPLPMPSASLPGLSGCYITAAKP